MGSGKSEVGRPLADVLGWKLEDTDERVAALEGLSIDRIFAESGEARFRQVEARVLDDLAGRSGVVVATGGGLFARAHPRALMRLTGVTVWLDVPLESIRERLGTGDDRPLWSRNEPIAMRALYEKRRAAYALADFRIDAATAGPAEIATSILETLRPVLH
jgi:shikimate kinase